MIGGVHTFEGNEALANINPYRYRGYYYDTETGLYFLKARYYDPTVGRFISMDDAAYIDPETIDGLNLFSDQIYTKFRNQRISGITKSTPGKMLAIESYNGIGGSLMEQLYSGLGFDDLLLSLV